ncbi:protease pro-enzyme activation domain-containing protein [Bradyrhizobium liaoningense]|uniref:S53 family peptidase n=1 Tax=Bradyrhizobium liaoningense TaxID=43992 RepID=UPI001BAB195B|nr:S53 family peptidase [Bradyrhizobium liaoningense]MBR0712647.1 S8/S53 family peptidase [Bradyrhizobium liaoningense]
MVLVPSSERPRKKGAKRLKDASPRQRVDLTLTLRGPKLPDAGALAGRTLSLAQFKAKCGASKTDADKVSRELRKFGLSIDGVSLETRSMQVSGTVAQMEAAFHPNLGIYESARQGTFRDREGEHQVPASLRQIITAVLGFGERRVAGRKPSKATARTVRPLKPFTPQDIESHYRFPPGNGAGQKIAIAEFGGGYFADDLDAYCKAFGRNVPAVKRVSIDAPIRNLAQMKRLKPAHRRDEIDYTGEVMMDVQIVAGLCPDADILVYFARDHQKGWVDLLNQAIKDRPVALSISWGAAEDSGDWSKAALNAINERLNLAALLGITVCCASGDDGSGDMQTNRRAHVDFPSSSPYALAVGGTMIRHKAGKPVEQTWRVGKGRRIRGVGGATGGGVSSVFAKPVWQRVAIASLNKGGFKGRVVPDLAALAGPPMYDLIFMNDRSPGGGTSASTPVLAALIARVNALLPRAKRQRWLTRLLYEKTQHGVALGHLACHDVTIGNNVSNPNPGRGFKAGRGFDAVSGWGVPIGSSLLLGLGGSG